MPGDLHDPRTADPGEPPVEVIEEWSRHCLCCPQCWSRPCDGCCAGGVCDDIPCRCYDGDDDHVYGDDPDSED